MTASLSKKAIGESHRPRGKCCVSWQAEAARHAVIPVPLDTDGIEERAGLAALGEDRARLTHGRMIKRQVRT